MISVAFGFVLVVWVDVENVVGLMVYLWCLGLGLSEGCSVVV